MADVVLPVTSYLENTGTMTNLIRHNQQIQLFEGFLHQPDIRVRYNRIRAHHEQSLDFSLMDKLHHFIGGHSLTR
ncbi:hypothetical protein [Paenibacillus polymyxa]|uniref:hypothetical protein n=1 Tax=Paenibacillus polymyxa TaxID=1406 RepID=UPI003AF32E47